jgi:Flp pilus assembly protein TadG
MKRRSERGQSLVETALVLPILLLLLLAIFDFGRAIYAYNTVSNAAREATRLAIVDQNSTAVTDEAHRSAIGLDPASVGVTFTTCPSPVKIGCPATVTVDYQWSAITPIIGSIVGPISLSSTTEMRIERVYQSP